MFGKPRIERWAEIEEFFALEAQRLEDPKLRADCMRVANEIGSMVEQLEGQLRHEHV